VTGDNFFCERVAWRAIAPGYTHYSLAVAAGFQNGREFARHSWAATTLHRTYRPSSHIYSRCLRRDPGVRVLSNVDVPARIYLPEKSRLLDAVYWKEIRGSFNRELGPATALMLTDRHIVLIAEEKGIGWFQFRRHTKHGAVITYFPLDRFVDFHIKAHKRFSILELDGCESQGRERIEVMIPTDKQEVVSRLIEKGAGPSPLQPLQCC
jgi:hypothetical protein